MSIHSHSHSSSVGRWRSVKTANDYRAMAEECAKWAREARDDDLSAPLLQLARGRTSELQRGESDRDKRVKPIADEHGLGVFSNAEQQGRHRKSGCKSCSLPKS